MVFFFQNNNGDKMFNDYLMEEVDDNIPNNMQCDVYEKGSDYVIELDVPGYSKENLKVEYSNGYISVIGTKSENKEYTDRKYIRKERSYGLYKRDFYVGKVIHEKIDAKYKDGVLVISVPKTNEKKENIVIK